MNAVTVPELQALLAHHEPPCVSIYMPTHRRHPDNEQDPIRYRNLVKRAEELLAGRSGRQRRDLIDPLRAIADRNFWDHQWEGLAVLSSSGFFRAFRLTGAVPELAVVADSFHTKPLIASLRGDRTFFVLALSRHRAQLYAGSALGLEPVQVDELPADLKSVLGDGDLQRYTGRHSAPVGGGASAVQHGHRDGQVQSELYTYFRAIDRALWAYLREETAPLVLAAVDEHAPLFRETSQYPYLVETIISGNVDRMSADELHAKAWPLVSRQLDRERDRVLSAFPVARERFRASSTLEEIARAATRGRVQALLHAESAHVWGRVDPETGNVEVRDQQRDERDGDVLDELCEMTLIRGGQVIPVPRDRMPGGTAIAAILRW